MTNLGKMLKQAQALQSQMGAMQAQLADMTVAGVAGAGMVEATMSGKGELRALKIDPVLVDPKDVSILEDLVVAAINDARAKVDATVAAEMAKLTGGLSLPPGMKLPF
ncbi:MAG: YbaB/EbfC family nucleoid-associated protein [Alphaproteobacteria bacterium]|nr:YbaB/EbfC family nucleoid-associated protein [Alphaproteobacteria bacterium]